MIRLAVPLILITLAAWGLLYGVQGKVRKETKTAIKQGCVTLSIASVVILALCAVFAIGRFINNA